MTDEKFPVFLQSTWIHKTTLGVYTVSQIITTQFTNQNMPVTNIIGDSHTDGSALNLPLKDWQKQLVPVPNTEFNNSYKYYMYQTETPTVNEVCLEAEFVPEVDCYGDVELNQTPYDSVHKPSHYKLDGLDIEWMDVRSALLRAIPQGIPYEAVTSWSEAITYLARMWGKNGVEDAEKALVYITRLVQILKTGKATGLSEPDTTAVMQDEQRRVFNLMVLEHIDYTSLDWIYDGSLPHIRLSSLSELFPNVLTSETLKRIREFHERQA